MKRIKIDLDSPTWKGQWALVTGASSGIGYEFSRQLASKGINLVLVARRIERLRALAREIERTHGIETKVHGMDLAQSGAAQQLRQWLDAAGLCVRLLVNNAGYGRWGDFESVSTDFYQDMLQVDVIAPTALCCELLHHLKQHDSAAVVMVSSPAALQPMPYLAVYAAAKAYVHSLSQALSAELMKYGILVQTLVPGPTRTEFDIRASAYESALKTRGEPEEVVHASLRGLARGSIVVYQARGCLVQRVFALLPARWVLSKLVNMFKPPR